MLSLTCLAFGLLGLQGADSQKGPAVDPGALRVVGSGVVCPLKGTAVQANVEGFGARVVVVQTFTNPSTKPIEAVYTFPLPQDSAVDGMRMIIGTRIIEGIIKRRAEARATYEQAKKEGKSTALLDQERPNVFTQSVANIPPGAQIQVALTYVQLLKFENDEFEFNFPMVVGHRFTDQTTPDPQKVTPKITPPGTRTGSNIRLTVNIAAGAPITSLHSVLHRVDTKKLDDSHAEVSLASADEIPNRDFILKYGVASGSVVGSLLTHADPQKGGFFTLILMPPKTPTAQQIAPKEAIMVMDQSGSQQGFPIQKSKELTIKMIDALNPNDTFNVITFANEPHYLWKNVRPNTPANREEAKEFVQRLEANGGTELHKAVVAALTPEPDPQRPRIVLFNTDGYIGGEAYALEQLQKYRGNSRMFTFGIGNSVNRYLIEAMSTEGRGDHEIITLNADSDAAVERFLKRTDSPVLTDISVRFEDVQVRDVLPRYIPDLFSEKPVIIKGRYTRPGRGFIVVNGKLGGKAWSKNYPVEFPANGNSGSAIASLWAREKVNDLTLHRRMQQAYGEKVAGQPIDDSRWEAAITQLCLDFAIMSEYTSFVAVDRKVVNPGGKQETIQVPVEMADGVSYKGIFGDTDKGLVGGKVDYVTYDPSDRSFIVKNEATLKGRKADPRLAPAPPVSSFRGGDPLLQVDALASAKVVAVFPGNEIKPLTWNSTSSKWEVRFDIPVSFKEGAYTVRVYVVNADGSRKTLDVPFEVSNTAPALKPKTELMSTGLLRLSLEPNPRWARLSLMTPWGQRLELELDSKTGKIQVEALLPKGFEGGWFRLIGMDRAHNQATLRLYINAKGEIEER
jgi:Ca-activated chloride channel family protein